jgi:hypothetical protein
MANVFWDITPSGSSKNRCFGEHITIIFKVIEDSFFTLYVNKFLQFYMFDSVLIYTYYIQYLFLPRLGTADHALLSLAQATSTTAV